MLLVLIFYWYLAIICQVKSIQQLPQISLEMIKEVEPIAWTCKNSV